MYCSNFANVQKYFFIGPQYWDQLTDWQRNELLVQQSRLHVQLNLASSLDNLLLQKQLWMNHRTSSISRFSWDIMISFGILCSEQLFWLYSILLELLYQSDKESDEYWEKWERSLSHTITTYLLLLSSQCLRWKLNYHRFWRDKSTRVQAVTPGGNIWLIILIEYVETHAKIRICCCSWREDKTS